MSLLFYLTQSNNINVPTEKIVEATIKITRGYYGWHTLELNNEIIVKGNIRKINTPITGSHIFESALSMPIFTMAEYQSDWYSIQISKFNPDINDTLEYLFQNIASKLVGKFPEIWTNPKYQSLPHAGCFALCTGLENYDEIPDDWK